MAAAELVMQDWSEKYNQILMNSGLSTPLLAGYVDDGRQGTSTLKIGMRYNKDMNKFTHSQDAEQEDKNKKVMGESRNERMARVCLVAMNSVNEDLEFTVESQEEYENERLPTLDFAIWQEDMGTLNHSYFQKDMKSPYVIMSRSAMATQQKIQILSNEVTRRIFNINKDKNTQQEYNKMLDKMTQELRNSGYNYRTARQVIVSGIRGWKTRIENRARKGQEIYRLAHSTTRAREYKKLLGKETWYKEQEHDKEPAQEWLTTKNLASQRVPEPWDKNQQGRKDKKSHTSKNEHPVVSVMFVPHTPGGELAKLLRENEEKISKMTENSIKIVERTGVKLQDTITKSNPWKGQDCGRKNCLL